MKKSFNHHDIEHHLRGQLSEAETNQLLNAANEDPSLGEELDFYESVSKVVRLKVHLAEAQTELRTEGFFQKKQHELNNSGPASGLRWWPRFAAAASILLLLALGTFWYATNNYSNQALVDVPTQRYLSQNTTRAATTITVPDYFKKTSDLLESESYASAIQVLKEVINVTPSDEAKLLLAFAHFKNADYAEAAELSGALAESDDLIIAQKAQWLSVQSGLANGQTDAVFHEALADIAAEHNHLFQQRAQNLQQ
ncbi:MAG: hypothetical protein AAFO94_02350 [Bacteroidota bacterium]